MRARAWGAIATAVFGLAWSAAPVAAQEAGWKTWTRDALGLSIQRPADLYESDPEPPAEHVRGEVEWGPRDHAWSILITSQPLERGATLAKIVAEQRKRNPKAEIVEGKVGDGIDAVRIWTLDDDTLATALLFLDKTGTQLIAIELSITLAEDDAGKAIDALKLSYNGTLAMFARMLATIRIAGK